MMATTLEISFLKHDDKNYFMYPLLCYNDIFCIFYRFCRINVCNVVLLFGSLCTYICNIVEILIFWLLLKKCTSVYCMLIVILSVWEVIHAPFHSSTCKDVYSFKHKSWVCLSDWLWSSNHQSQAV
jgi:hypothetical protein